MGTMLGSRYVLDDVLGSGAFGEVWRGRVRETNEPRAFKILNSTVARDPSAVSRFVQERRILLDLIGPNVVRVHDMVVEGETLAMVMDLVEGGDLRAHLRRSGPKSEAEGAQIAADIAEGVAVIHAGGVIHRDLKPENVLIDTDGAGRVLPRITDFGISSIVGTGTRTTRMAGTPSYIAPELIEDLPPSEASDLYSLGIMLYEIVTGAPPFRAENVLALLRQHADEVPVRPAGMSDGLWSIISTLLAKDPSQRRWTAASLAASLRSLAGTTSPRDLVESTVVRPTTPPVPPPPTTGDAVDDHTIVRSARPAPPPIEDHTVMRPRRDTSATSSTMFIPPSPEERPRRKAWPFVVGGGVAVLSLIAVAVVGVVLIGQDDAAPSSTPTSGDDGATIAAVQRQAATSVVETVSLTARPSEVAMGNGAVSIASGDEFQLMRLDLESGDVQAFPAGGAAYGLAADRELGTVYLAILRDDRVIEMTSNGTVKRSVDVGREPARLAFDPTASRLYAANSKSDSVSVIDTRTFDEVTRIPVGAAPAGLDVDPEAGLLYVTNRRDGTVSIVDTGSNKVLATTRTGNWPFRVTADPDHQRAFVMNAHGHTVSVIDADSRQVVKTLHPGKGPVAAVVDPAADALYITLADDDAVAVFDLATLEKIKVVPVGVGPTGIALDPRTGRVYVANRETSDLSVLGN